MSKNQSCSSSLRSKVCLILFGLLGILWLDTGRAQAESLRDPSPILMQGFHWNSWRGQWYKTLQSNIAGMRDLEVTHLWLPPPSNSASREGYLPRELYNLNSAYGSAEELAGLIRELKTQGIQAVADVVINHRVGNSNFADFSFPEWGCAAVTADDEWGGRCGSPDSGEPYEAARDIDHAQAFVQQDITRYLNQYLKGIGFQGWRFDYSKGYDTRYAKLYIQSSQPTFCVGETWPTLDYNAIEAHRQQQLVYIEQTERLCSAFDFTTKGLLNKAFRDGSYNILMDSRGQAAGLLGLAPQNSVTFVDNHDTGPSESCTVGQNLWPVPCDKVGAGYAYILTHPGTPTLYYPHVFIWGLKDSIQTLVKLRREMGVEADAELTIEKAQQGLYAATIKGQKGELAVRLGSVAWSPGEGWQERASGFDWTVWSRL